MFSGKTFLILQIRNDCGHSGFAFSRKGSWREAASAALAPLRGAVAQRLRGFKSAEHKKSFSEATWIFCMEPNSFGVTRGEQPLVRASRASKVAGAFLVLFWHAKENISGGKAFYKSHKTCPTRPHSAREASLNIKGEPPIGRLACCVLWGNFISPE